MFKEFDSFDIAGALYFWLQHNWDGQSDPLYSAFCQLTAPGMYRRGGSQLFEDIEETENYIYEMLTRENYEDALGSVLNYETVDADDEF
jgi:hypothetical protein